MRAFVAIPLPPHLQSTLADYAGGAGIAGARPIPAENLHVTVHFLGAVGDHDAAGLAAALAEACRAAEPFAITVADASLAPPRRPRMIWARLDAPEAFADLVAAVADAAAPFAPDARGPRPGRPHVTLARLRRPLRRATPLPPLPAAGTTVAVPACVLVRSELGRGGSRYTTLATLPLGE